MTYVSNIELPLKYGDFLGGHIVSGHVHCSAIFVSLFDNNLWIDLGNNISRATYKASITINGVSLTIAEMHETKIRIALIPETLKRTNLGLFEEGEYVNVEFDNYKIYEDSYFMKLAIEEGEKGITTTSPNPWVGCVIVKNNSIISTGYHECVGSPHAEVHAIAKISDYHGSTMYVTLEPCCHHGRTPPCTDIISHIQKWII